MNMNGDISELERLLQRLEALDAEAAAEVERAKALYDLALQRQRMIRAMMRAGRPPEKQEGKPKASTPRKRISEAKRNEILLVITSLARSLPEGQFSARDVVAASGVHQTTVNAAFNELRDQGLIRRVGVDPTRRNRNLYALESDA